MVGKCLREVECKERAKRPCHAAAGAGNAKNRADETGGADQPKKKDIQKQTAEEKQLFLWVFDLSHFVINWDQARNCRSGS